MLRDTKTLEEVRKAVLNKPVVVLSFVDECGISSAVELEGFASIGGCWL
jgi:hypothetical protein